MNDTLNFDYIVDENLETNGLITTLIKIKKEYENNNHPQASLETIPFCSSMLIGSSFS